MPPKYNYSNNCFSDVSIGKQHQHIQTREKPYKCKYGIVINALGFHQIARIMNVFTQAKNRINASIVINGLGICQLAGIMNVFTQEQNHRSASIVVSSSAVHQIVSNMNLHMQG